MIAIMGALDQEILDIRRRMMVKERVAERHGKLYRGRFLDKEVLLVKTGMGKNRAEKAARLILERYPVGSIISLGFAGAVAPELNIGDVVICSRLYCLCRIGGGWREEGRCHSNRRLLELAAGRDALPEGWHLGSSASILELESSTSRLAGLGEAFPVQIVDMESYWIASLAAAANIPFIAIRSVSDTPRSTLKPFDEIFTPEGTLLFKKAALAFLIHPRYLWNTYLLYQNVLLARKNLLDCVSRLVRQM
ncbi:MAG TPA: hypothetical protein PKO38_02000 [Bacillota bacterium]|jgi:adenosylhomocysteine nucleosidase|nr:hypothetical protein [Bacillota bacterium]HOB86447.1 hypothetical protein [Bacillota bacterium]HOP68568.1 hypothetical protein [Bacillota bacterium]HPT33351.1 hypothetical protein [Bacillota bacterium]HPZ65028.1 hypothetical protein [Bacillota bacterium]